MSRSLPVRWIDVMNNATHVYPDGRTIAAARADGTLFSLNNYCPPGSATPQEVLAGYGRLFGAAAYALVSIADVAHVA